VIALEVADLIVIASRVLGLDTGQVLDLLDPAAAERALAQARPAGDPAADAAALLDALVRQRPLRRGSQQVALAAMLQFLALNGQDMDPGVPLLVAAMVIQLAAGTLGTKDVADWLAPRLRPSGRTAARMKEAPMPEGMFERLTDRARRVVVLAQDEARELGHGSVGPEHVLLGLLAVGGGVAAVALESLGISLEETRERVAEIAGRGQDAPAGRIPFTPAARQLREEALREAQRLGHDYVGTEHLLLALPCEGDGVAARVLAAQGAAYAQVRERVLDLLAPAGEQASPKTRMVRVPVPAGLADALEQFPRVRRQKAAAVEAGDFEGAVTLREREEWLRAEIARLTREWGAGGEVPVAIAEEDPQVRRELDRLRDVARQHGIGPYGGTARTA
jgi:Clp amino terminal domain, pathogenicity island component